MNDLAINEPLALELFAGEAKTVKKDGNDKTVWECARFELDALTSEQVVNLVEEGLSAEGVYGKVIPPADELPALSVDIYRQMHRDWVVEALSELTSLPEIQKQLADEFIEKFKLANSERYINA